MLTSSDRKQLIESIYLLGEDDVDEITQRLDDVYWQILASLRTKKLSTQLKDSTSESEPKYS